MFIQSNNGHKWHFHDDQHPQRTRTLLEDWKLFNFIYIIKYEQKFKRRLPFKQEKGCHAHACSVKFCVN